MPGFDLETAISELERATTPADVFGTLSGSPAEQLAQLKKRYRHRCRQLHPDHYHDPASRDRATVAFQQLTAWRDRALAALAVPAASAAPWTLTIGRRIYTVGDPLAEGDLALLYHCQRHDGQPAVLKLVRDAADNDLLANEAARLRHLLSHPATAGFRPYLPTLNDAFTVADGGGAASRQALILPHYAGFISLRALRRAYPDGLPAEHMAWIWRRLLVALTITHRAGLVHTAVLPDHVLIHPTERGLVLIDWAYAVALGSDEAVLAISQAYEGWYPVEVWRRQPPTPATDLCLAARCMVDLLGGDPLTGRVPTSVPRPIGLFLAGTLRHEPQQRPDDAAALLSEFDTLLATLYGRRRYQPLTIP